MRVQPFLVSQGRVIYLTFFERQSCEPTKNGHLRINYALTVEPETQDTIDEDARLVRQNQLSAIGEFNWETCSP